MHNINVVLSPFDFGLTIEWMNIMRNDFMKMEQGDTHKVFEGFHCLWPFTSWLQKQNQANNNKHDR